MPDEIDLGDDVLMPGLINAHTHLEFSDLDQPIGEPGISFTKWIKLVVEHRVRESRFPDFLNRKSQAIHKGLIESRDAGVAHLGEIATQPFSTAHYSANPAGVTAFLELLGRNDDQLPEKLSAAKSAINEIRSSSLNGGLSPHAPYSVSPNLLDEIVSLAAAQELPVAMHLAECKAELELLEKTDGPFVELLQDLGSWFPESYVKQTRPLDYLRKLARLQRIMIIHGNYLAEDELDFISQNQPKFSIVYCPRTHQFFRHERYPLRQMLNLGINVALGTDSRASNPDLNLFEEIKLVADKFPDVDPDKIIEMATLGGAKALGLDKKLGSLAIGKRASFSVATSKNNALDDPFELILNADNVMPFRPRR